MGLRLPRQRTVTGRLAVETALVTAGALAVGFAAGAWPGGDVATSQAVSVLGVLAAGMGCVAAGFGFTASRVAGNRRAAWLVPALALYSLLVVPATVQPAGASAGRAAVDPLVLVGLVGVAVLVLVAVRPPPGLGNGVPWLGALAFALLAIVVAEMHVLDPAVPALTYLPAAAGIGVLLGWTAVSLAVVVAGYRAASPPLWRIGLGFGVVASAHVDRLLDLGPAAAADVDFAALRLLGILVVLLGTAQLLRHSLSRVLADSFTGQEQARLADVREERLRSRDAVRVHELRNGLVGLAGLARHLDGLPTDDEDSRRTRAAVVAEFDRLTRLLRRGTEPSDGPRLYCASEVVEELAALWRAGGMHLVTSVRPWLMVSGSREVLAQVLTNLLHNCSRHAPGARVEVIVREDGGQVLVDVHDDGSVATGSDAGEGIGMQVSRELLRAEGGDLFVRQPDTRWPGYRVSVAVPLATMESGGRCPTAVRHRSVPGELRSGTTGGAAAG
jgi:two-component system, OmpR family, sensor kinase